MRKFQISWWESNEELILLEPILPRGFPVRGITLKIPCLLPISTQDKALRSLNKQIKNADIFALTILSCSRLGIPSVQLDTEICNGKSLFGGIGFDE